MEAVYFTDVYKFARRFGALNSLIPTKYSQAQRV